MRADRLVSLVLLLQARGRTSARVLARELEVSVRTVYRDLAALSAAGVPVVAGSGPGGGCELLDGYRFALRGLRPEEAEALLILGVPDVLADLGLDAALTAAQHQVSVTAGRPAAGLVHLDMPRWFTGAEPVPELGAVARAVRLGRMLAFRYRDRARVVAPLGLVNKAGTWYLVAVDEKRRNSVYRMGRIGAARLLDEPAKRPDGFSLGEFWARWSAEFAASLPRLEVTVRASPTALDVFPEVFGDQVRQALSEARPAEAAPWATGPAKAGPAETGAAGTGPAETGTAGTGPAETGTAETGAAGTGPAEAGPAETGAADGWRVVTLTFQHERAAAHRLAGFGDTVEVLAPAGVRDLLVATAYEIIGRYGSLTEPGGAPPPR